jgi:hypothetical protein
MSLVQNSHANNLWHLETSQNMELTKLKAYLDELRSFDEKDQDEIQRLQMDNELLRKTMEEC